MFANIVCATDLSPRSHAALETAVQMAFRHGALLTVLNVHEEFLDKTEMVMLRVSVAHMQEHFREIAISAKAKMAAEIAAVGVDDLRVDYLLREGKAADVILKTVENIDRKSTNPGSTLLVMGSNGRDSLKDQILGSVAERIVRHCSTPVMVIPYLMG